MKKNSAKLEWTMQNIFFICCGFGSVVSWLWIFQQRLSTLPQSYIDNLQTTYFVKYQPIGHVEVLNFILGMMQEYD